MNLLFGPQLEKRRIWRGPNLPSARAAARGFTMLEILIAVALAGLIMIALNSVIFSMGELWGRGADERLFQAHVRNVTRFLESELRAAVLPPAARLGDTPITGQDITLQTGAPEPLLTFLLPSGSRLISWAERPLPEVVCSLQARAGEGLVLLWRSRLETRFSEDPPRELVLSPWVTELNYDYYDADFRTWSTETALKKNTDGTTITPQRVRVKFAYRQNEEVGVISLPQILEGLTGT